MRTRNFVAGWLLALTVGTGAVRAQVATAALKGRVVDGDGAALPGVPVSLSSASLALPQKTAVTDADGNFRFLLLPPADDYYLDVSYPGFASMRLGPVDLDPGRTTVQPIVLHEAEALTSHVEVVASGSQVDLTSTGSSTTFNSQYIENLPIIGRNYQDLLTLTPGVTDTDGDGNPNVQGARQTGLQYRLDGDNVTDPSTGTFGQNFNVDAIESLEVLTGGADAEYGRADGGFTNIVTRSGSNEFEGRFRMYWRGRILDGNRTTMNAALPYRANTPESDMSSVEPYLTLGGPIVRDKLWYFTSVQYLDRKDPVLLPGASIVRGVRARNTFAKLTWQVGHDDKLALQLSEDPARFTGRFLDFGVSPESDATQDQSGRTLQLLWTSILSPSLLLEAGLLHFRSELAFTPVSNKFRPFAVTTRVVRNGNQVSLQAQYPAAACSFNGAASGFVENCDPAGGRLAIYQRNQVTGAVTGPFPVRSDASKSRDEIRSSLTYSADSGWGEHQIKAGLEFAEEEYHDGPINNPYFTDNFEPCPACRDQAGRPIENAVKGLQILTVPTPGKLRQDAAGFNSSAYLSDAWKPRANVSVGLGLRIDKEDIDTAGFTYFDPRNEKRSFMGIVAALCNDARRVQAAGGRSNWGLTCDPRSGFLPGGPPVNGNLIYAMDQSTPEALRRYDRNGDGVFDSGVDGSVWSEAYTNYPDRLPENFEITNLNLSPRLSLAWDPGGDGKTKLFATWGRFYDRLYLDTVRYEAGPDSIDYVFEPDPGLHVFTADLLSRRASSASIHQVQRNLRTPHTDAFTLGLEREMASPWIVSLTFTQRLAWDLLQDVDVNHVRCDEYRREFGIDPAQVCPQYTDASGKVHLGEDLFGSPNLTPNGAPDLYNVNPNFNQILRIGNYNSSTYRSLTVEVTRRLHTNWQMRASYTYSRSLGQAEDFVSALGNDPSTTDDEAGYLAYDQRHRIVVTATAQLPRGIELGGVLRWESGTPYSVIAEVIDQDNVGNVTDRTFFPTRQRNDQRNGGAWTLDARLARIFQVGGVRASAELSAENLLGSDDVTIGAYRISSASGVQLQAGPTGLRRLGRIWEVGMTLNF